MILRNIEPIIKKLANERFVITITGPRQSGKTTLAKKIFKNKPYVSLEDYNSRMKAVEDPKGFLKDFSDGAVLDEIQHVPELLSYIQGIVDDKKKKGMFIIIGSQNFALMKSVTQSLAGRTGIIKLLPFSFKELEQISFRELEQIGIKDIDDFLLHGFHPCIYNGNVGSPSMVYADYFETYIQRDLKAISQIHNIHIFQKFVRLCAGRIGQIFNANQLSNELGISVPTIQHWISILEQSYIIFLLQPYYSNIKKRLIKSPKIYFYDVGLASYLLGISNKEQMKRDPLRGYLIENMVVSELFKTAYNLRREPLYYFYRDQHGNEVDIIFSNGQWLIPVEIKSSQTFNKDFVRGLNYFKELFPDRVKEGYLIYNSKEQITFKGWNMLALKNSSEIFNPLLKENKPFIFDSKEKLYSFLDRLDCNVVSRTIGREHGGADRERYCLKKYINDLAEKDILEYPFTLIKRESPDFYLQSNKKNIGLEITEATTSEYQKELTQKSKKPSNECRVMTGSEKDFNVKVAKIIMDNIKKKTEKLNKPHWMEQDVQELLLYQNAIPNVLISLEDVCEYLKKMIAEFQKEKQYERYFDKISIMNDSELYYDIMGEAVSEE